MWENIEKAKNQFPEHAHEFDFCPKSYNLPKDYKKFCSDRKALDNKEMYILKPNNSTEGKNI